jgi:hypothetical protein
VFHPGASLDEIVRCVRDLTAAVRARRAAA